MPAKTPKQRRFLRAVASGSAPRTGHITPAQAKKALGIGEGKSKRARKKGK